MNFLTWLKNTINSIGSDAPSRALPAPSDRHEAIYKSDELTYALDGKRMAAYRYRLSGRTEWRQDFVVSHDEMFGGRNFAHVAMRIVVADETSDRSDGLNHAWFTIEWRSMLDEDGAKLPPHRFNPVWSYSDVLGLPADWLDEGGPADIKNHIAERAVKTMLHPAFMERIERKSRLQDVFDGNDAASKNNDAKDKEATSNE